MILFNIKIQGKRYNNLTSGQVRKLLSALKYKVKIQKRLIAKALNAYRESRPHYEVKGIPHITVVPGTGGITKKEKNEERAD
jgi:hypothetical protein